MFKGRVTTIIATAWRNKGQFLTAFFVVFLLSYLFLVAIDFVPEPKVEKNHTESSAVLGVESVSASTDTEAEPQEPQFTSPVFPNTIHIPRLNRTVTVLNPQSREIADLDQALLSGVVRHPDSADLSIDGNVFILGHSSHLPNVMNRNFQAFNDIEDLEWGDTIELVSADHIFVYEVDKVYKANAQNTTVPISGTGARLTLATCNSFGSIDDRFIVEAKRVEIRPR